MTTASENPLAAALRAPNWDANVEALLADEELVERITTAGKALAVWARQIETAEGTNPAVAFFREAQIQVQTSAALIGLGLYRPAINAARTLVESVLYYTYFRNHPAELGTLQRSDSFFVFFKDIVEHHTTHTESFQHYAGPELRPWYRRASALVHAQIPGQLVTHTSIAELAADPDCARTAGAFLSDACAIAHHLCLSCVAAEIWTSRAATTAENVRHPRERGPGETKGKLPCLVRRTRARKPRRPRRRERRGAVRSTHPTA